MAVIILFRVVRPAGFGLGNCVEGPLLECLDLFVVQGIRCII